MTTQEKNGITEGVIWKQLLIFFFPILVGSFFQQLYNTVDSVIVGQFVGKEALSSVGGSAGQIISLVVGFFTGVSTGATVIISQYFGAGKKEEIEESLHTAYAFALVGGLVLGIAGIVFAPQMLLWMNTPEELIAESVLYVRVYFSGLIFIFIYNMGAAILRAVGDSKRPLYYLIVCSVVNIILDLLLILVIPLGVLGAAIATLIAQAVSAVLVTVTLMYRTEGMKLCLSQIRMYKRMLQSILKIGLPAGFEAIMYSISNIIVQVSINNFGVDTMAAWTAYSKIDFIFWMINSAFGISVMTFVGQNYGAHLYDRIQKGAKTALAIALTMAVSLSVILCFGGSYITKLFSSDPAIINQCQSLILFLMPFYFSYCCVEIFSGTMRGCGESFKPMLLVCIGICVLRVAWVTFISPHYPTLKGVVISYPITWFTTSFLFIIYYKHFKKDHFGA